MARRSSRPTNSWSPTIAIGTARRPSLERTANDGGAAVWLESAAASPSRSAKVTAEGKRKIGRTFNGGSRVTEVLHCIKRSVRAARGAARPLTHDAAGRSNAEDEK